MSIPRAVSTLLFAVVLSLTTIGTLPGQPVAAGGAIAGRIDDPHKVRTADTILMIGWGTERTWQASPVPIAADGTFRTRRMAPGTYVLELVRTPHSASAPATPIGLAIVTLGGLDRTGVTVTARPDVRLEGRYVMDSDDPAPVWPTSIRVSTSLGLPDGRVVVSSSPTYGAPGGRFTLQNPFGPRLLRVGWAGSGGWRFQRVVLDGVDVTNTPVDYSRHAGSRLEVVFSNRPGR